MTAHDLVDRRVERGGEEQGLSGARHLAQEPLDLGQKAHVGHAVRFVDDKGGDLAEFDSFTVRGL